MNCSQSQIAIRAAVYGDGVLDAVTRAHLATCEECREDLADWTLDRSLEGQPVDRCFLNPHRALHRARADCGRPVARILSQLPLGLPG